LQTDAGIALPLAVGKPSNKNAAEIWWQLQPYSWNEISWKAGRGGGSFLYHL